MKLLEYLGKDLFRQYDIDIPKGTVVEHKDELRAVTISFPWVMKSQVLVGGRGKAGGIKFAHSLKEAEKLFDELMALTIKGEKVKRILIEEKLTFDNEYYLSVVLDRSTRQYLMMFSDEGGIDIESMAEKIVKITINPLIGMQPYHLRRLPKNVRSVARKLYTMFVENDCELAEINPLVISNEGAVAADAKVTMDNNALFRHKDLPKEDVELTPLEKEAKEKNIAFVQLEGTIGVIANGAGLTMATLDSLNEFNGKGGVFLDLGGTDDPVQVKKAFELMVKARPAIIFLNLFGGITKCDTVAQGIIEFLEEHNVECEVVARIKGMNEERARVMLSNYVTPIESFEDAAKKAAELGG